MLVELGHVFLEFQGQVMNFLNAVDGLFHHLRARLGSLFGFGGRGRGVARILGNFLHCGVHFVHGCGRFGQALRGFRRAPVGLLDLG